MSLPLNKQKIKSKPKSNPVSTGKMISRAVINSDNLVRLKVTVHKGARIESVPLRKLEKLSTQSNLFWKLEDDWLILYGFS